MKRTLKHFDLPNNVLLDDVIKKISALEQSAGVWSLENHLELKDEKSIEK